MDQKTVKVKPSSRVFIAYMVSRVDTFTATNS